MATLGGISEPKGTQNSLEINSLAQFAVEEHNKKQKDKVLQTNSSTNLLSESQVQDL
ncbi:putative cystatin [Helianthus debilis subsp. tardiflorus]